MNKKKEKYIYKEVSETEVTQRPGGWLRRLGLLNLILAMEMLSGEYGLAWAEKWRDHLGDPRWLDKAMDNTFDRIRDEDQELLREMYEEWLWYAANLDLEVAVDLGFVAEVCLLWGDGRRVVDGGQVQTVLVSLGGASREDAKRSLTSEYEFVRWW